MVLPTVADSVNRLVLFGESLLPEITFLGFCRV